MSDELLKDICELSLEDFLEKWIESPRGKTK